jgi:hypothetical protein
MWLSLVLARELGMTLRSQPAACGCSVWVPLLLAHSLSLLGPLLGVLLLLLAACS